MKIRNQSRKKRQQETKMLMLTKITTSITFFKRFQTMRRRSIMKIVEKRNKKKLNRHRRHYEMLFETLQIVSHPTKPNNVESKEKSFFKLKIPNTKQKPMTLKSLQHSKDKVGGSGKKA